MLSNFSLLEKSKHYKHLIQPGIHILTVQFSLPFVIEDDNSVFSNTGSFAVPRPMTRLRTKQTTTVESSSNKGTLRTRTLPQLSTSILPELFEATPPSTSIATPLPAIVEAPLLPPPTLPSRFTYTGSTRQTRLNEDQQQTLANLYLQYPPIAKPSCSLDPLHIKLKSYHDNLSNEISNVATQKLTDEVKTVIQDVSKIDSINREFKWTAAEEERLKELNEQPRQMSIPDDWYWGAATESQQWLFNQNRLEFCITHEIQFEIIKCSCGSSGVLVGLDQIGSTN